VRRLAALYPQEVIGEALVDTELSADSTPLMPGFTPPALSGAGKEERAASLAAAVERHMAELFKSYGDGLPPPGLYHRVLREIEYPLISAVLAATRGNQIKAAELLGLNRNTLRKKVRDLDIRLLRTPQ